MINGQNISGVLIKNFSCICVHPRVHHNLGQTLGMLTLSPRECCAVMVII